METKIGALLDPKQVENARAQLQPARTKRDSAIEPPAKSRMHFIRRITYKRELDEALIQVSQSGDVDSARRLLKKGADVNCRYAGTLTPLALAASYGNLPMVQLLASSGADLNLSNNQGKAALHWAFNGHKEIADLLISAGADVSLKDNDGRSAVFGAVAFLWKDTLEAIVSKGGDINAKDNQGATPLIRRVQMGGDIGFIDFMLDLGADANVRDNSGKSAIDYARDSKQKAVAALLEEYKI